MFVSAKIHAILLTDLAVERAKRASAEASVTVLVTQMDFLRLRVNQLEAERAMLLQSVTKLPMPVPQLVMTTPREAPQPIRDFFTDLGDEAAKAMGIEHNPDGTLKVQ